MRLEGGSSRCSGLLQVKRQGIWTEVLDHNWDLKLADVVCRQLDCGSAVQTLSKYWGSTQWRITPSCLKSESVMRKCLTKRSVTSTSVEIICSGNSISTHNTKPHILIKLRQRYLLSLCWYHIAVFPPNDLKLIPDVFTGQQEL